MKNFLKNHGLWVLLSAAIIAVVLALMSYFSSTSSPLVNVTKTITAPFRTAYTAVADWFNDWQNHYEDVTELENENDDVIILNSNEIDLKEITEQAICCALPITCLCSDDCKGLCPVCGCYHLSTKHDDYVDYWDY